MPNVNRNSNKRIDEEKDLFIRNFFGHHNDPQEIVSSRHIISDTLVGLELELEGIGSGMDTYKSSYWNVVGDGSLNESGKEFVFKRPFGGRSIDTALKSINKVMEERGITPQTGVRTSLHVHIDVRDLDNSQYINMILIYLVFEEVLFKYCGEERMTNPFCRPLSQLDTIQRLSLAHDRKGDKGGTLSRVISEIRDRKYCAINLGSTSRFGSIEFRLHKGEYRYPIIRNWINILLRLKEYALNNDVKDWQNLFSDISNQSPTHFLKEVFKEQGNLLLTEESEGGIYNGMRICQDIINGSNLEKVNLKKKGGGLQFDEAGTIIISNRFQKYINSKRIKVKKDIVKGEEKKQEGQEDGNRFFYDQGLGRVVDRQREQANANIGDALDAIRRGGRTGPRRPERQPRVPEPEMFQWVANAGEELRMNDIEDEE